MIRRGDFGLRGVLFEKRGHRFPRTFQAGVEFRNVLVFGIS